jgi:hypothetical protein
VNKIESTVIWGLLRELKTNGEKNAFLGYWGYVFEYYVGWLFQTYAILAFNTVHLAPKYVDDPNKEICDVIVICGKTAVLIEAKLATCPSKTRYAGDYKKMKNFLEDKLVKGVGVDQLVSAVTVITTDPKKTSEKIPVIPGWLEKIDTLMPVIVTRDDIGSSWSVNAYLNNRFSERLLGKKRHKRITVAPLLSVSGKHNLAIFQPFANAFEFLWPDAEQSLESVNYAIDMDPLCPCDERDRTMIVLNSSDDISIPVNRDGHQIDREVFHVEIASFCEFHARPSHSMTCSEGQARVRVPESKR